MNKKWHPMASLKFLYNAQYCLPLVKIQIPMVICHFNSLSSIYSQSLLLWNSPCPGKKVTVAEIWGSCSGYTHIQEAEIDESSAHQINFLLFIWSRTPVIGKVLAQWECFLNHNTYREVSSQTCTEVCPLGSDYSVKLTTNIRIPIY